MIAKLEPVMCSGKEKCYQISKLPERSSPEQENNNLSKTKGLKKQNFIR